jgi:hypothetical protein
MDSTLPVCGRHCQYHRFLPAPLEDAECLYGEAHFRAGCRRRVSWRELGQDGRPQWCPLRFAGRPS